MNIVVFGPPGSGKGTQSALLVERKNMVQIGTGDLLRDSVKKASALGVKAKTYMEKGELVPDSLVIEMVKEVLGAIGGREFILDGYPRTVPQAIALDSMLKELNLSVDKAIFLAVPKSDLTARLVGRRVCEKCWAVFHIENHAPRIAGVCDKCGGNLMHRSDDAVDAIETRLIAYDSATFPLKDYYTKANKFVSIDGVGDAEEIYRRLEKVMK